MSAKADRFYEVLQAGLEDPDDAVAVFGRILVDLDNALDEACSREMPRSR